MYEISLSYAARASIETLAYTRQCILNQIKNDIKQIKANQKNNIEYTKIGFENDDDFDLAKIQNVLKKAQALELPLRIYVTGYSKFGKEKEHIEMLFSVQMINNLIALNSYLVNNGAEPLRFMEDPIHAENAWTLSQVVGANEEISAVVDTIKLQQFSPFEAMAFIHHYITNQFPYNENRDNPYMPRSIIGALNSNDIVCVGYARLTKAIIDKLNMPGLSAETFECLLTAKNDDTFKEMIDQDGDGKFSKEILKEVKNKSILHHLQNLITINDEKYNINGKYVSDSCWDCKTEMFPHGKGFGHFMYPISNSFEMLNDNFRLAKINKVKVVSLLDSDKQKIFVDNDSFIKNAKHSKPIPLETYKACITKMLQKTYPTIDRKTLDDVIEKYIIMSGLIAASTFNQDAKNSFKDYGNKYISENPDKVMQVDSQEIIR